MKLQNEKNSLFPKGNYFFVTSKFGETFGGLTSSMFKKGRIFGEYAGVKTNILTFNYNPNYDTIIAKLVEKNIMSDSISFINLYDYFRKEPIKYIKKYNSIDEDRMVFHKQGSSIYRFFENGLYKMYKRTDENGNLKYVHHFNENRYKYKTDEYDDKGYLSRSYFYDILHNPDEIRQTIYYRRNGSAYMTKWFKCAKNVSRVERIQLYNLQGEIIKVLDNDLQLQHYFLDVLTKESENNFIVSEARACDPIILSYNNKNAKKIVMIHSNHTQPPRKYDSPLDPDYETVFKEVRKADAIVFLTDGQKNDVEKRYGKNKNFYLIPHATSSKIIFNSSIEKNHKKAVVIGRLTKGKRIDHAIKAFIKVIEEVPDAVLEIYGEGSEKEKLSQLIIENNLQQHVFLKGFTNEPFKVYENSLFSIFTSQHEGFGLVVLESLSVGCPVISYNIKYGPSDMIDDGVNGYLIKDKDIDLLASKMIFAFKNPKIIDDMSDNSRNIINKYSVERFVDNWKTLFEQLISKK